MMRRAALTIVLLACAVPATAQAAPGTTTLTLGGSADAQLRAAGVTVSAVAPATRAGRTVALAAYRAHGGSRPRHPPRRPAPAPRQAHRHALVAARRARRAARAERAGRRQAAHARHGAGARRRRRPCRRPRAVRGRAGDAHPRRRAAPAQQAQAHAPAVRPDRDARDRGVPLRSGGAGLADRPRRAAPVEHGAGAAGAAGDRRRHHVGGGHVARARLVHPLHRAGGGDERARRRRRRPRGHDAGERHAARLRLPLPVRAGVVRRGERDGLVGFTGRVHFSYKSRSIALDAAAPELEINGRGVAGADAHRRSPRGAGRPAARRGEGDHRRGCHATDEEVPGRIPGRRRDRRVRGYYFAGDPFGWFTVRFTT